MNGKPDNEKLKVRIRALELENRRLRKAEKTLRDSEERFRRLSDIAEEGIMITEKDVIIDGNKALTRLLGYELTELIGMQSIQLADPEFRDKIRRYRAAHYQRPFEISALRKDGEIIHCRTLGKPYQFNGRNLRVTVVTDITEFKKAEKEIIGQTRQLDKRVRELNCLLGISKLLQRPDITLEGFFQGVLQLIPPAFQDSENTCARFLFGHREYKSLNFRWTPRRESCDVHVKGKRVGLLEVCYLKEDHPDGWPFLQEEVRLIKALAERLGEVIELKQAYKDLMESEETYRSVFENTGTPVVIIEKDFTIFMANHEFEKFTGIQKNQLEGRVKLNDFMAGSDPSPMPDDPRPGEGHSSRMLSDGEVDVLAENGEIRTVDLKLGRISDQDRSIVSMVDITERKKIETSLRISEENLRKENKCLSLLIKGRYQFGGMIGRSPAMQRVYDMILEAAAVNANVIIFGESGTGKELVARAIHDMSDRAEKEFVPVNCGAMPENIMESELFGYRKGAFTGADRDREGLLDRAEGGTLFMDEIGDIGLNMQVKLLRAIEGGGYKPVGINVDKKPDIRIITATNRNLRERVGNGFLREDFYYRINIIPIHLPPLRERKEDIPLLVDHFFKDYTKGAPSPPLKEHVLQILMNYEWPGNVRELQNVIHRYVTLGKLDLIGIHSLNREWPETVDAAALPNPSQLDLRSALENYEKRHILGVLEKQRWRKGISASILNINRRTLYEKMKKHGLT